MSEKEKQEAIPTEGTVTVTETKESKLRKWIDSHPKTVKWVKRIGVGAAWLGSVGLAYLAGVMTKGGTAEPMAVLNEADMDNEDEDDLEESAE